jgi:ankyrin repeat protein
MHSLARTARRGTYEEFLSRYEPGAAARAADSTGRTLLHAALANGDLHARVAIADRLLDDGADAAALSGAEGFTTLHVLLGRGKHDFPREAPLLERLLDGGADVNRAVDRFGTPLHTVARQFAFTDASLAPFYDVLFARPDLWGADGRPPYLDVARRMLPLRAGLVARIEEYLGVDR